MGKSLYCSQCDVELRVDEARGGRCNDCGRKARVPHFTLWWQRGWFSPWHGYMLTLDGRGGMVWLGRLHFGWQF